ncbi:hypothetical protein Nepgr_001986 [Nepenthes gracilis]|uniref:Uncharacterized protein n=1 Tax=Nepenthes gracilis TaxID=150966 RepID=A0AAD3P6A8_NEPGR|nr:hypothetical protein Nepgr_001986 [Nepenthes gracilis]
MVNTRVQASKPARDVTSSDQDHAAGARKVGDSTCNSLYSDLQERRLEEEEASQKIHTAGQHSSSGGLARSKLSKARDGASRVVRSIGDSSRPVIRHPKERTELRTFLNSKRSSNAAQARSKTEKIWNRVFKDNEHTMDLDRSPFTAKILNRHIEARRVPRLIKKIKLSSCISPLIYGDFFRHLAHKNPQTFREVESIAKAYAAQAQRRPMRLSVPSRLNSLALPRLRERGSITAATTPAESTTGLNH